MCGVFACLLAHDFFPYSNVLYLSLVILSPCVFIVWSIFFIWDEKEWVRKSKGMKKMRKKANSHRIRTFFDFFALSRTHRKMSFVSTFHQISDWLRIFIIKRFWMILLISNLFKQILIDFPMNLMLFVNNLWLSIGKIAQQSVSIIQWTMR